MDQLSCHEMQEVLSIINFPKNKNEEKCVQKVISDVLSGICVNGVHLKPRYIIRDANENIINITLHDGKKVVAMYMVGGFKSWNFIDMPIDGNRVLNGWTPTIIIKEAYEDNA